MAKEELKPLKSQVMKAKGYYVNNKNPDDVKYEVANEQGVALKRDGGNENLTSKQAGKVGGPIGGNMVKEMIEIAQEKINNKG